MGKCANCGATLDPAWKFCITCGTPVAAHALNEPVAEVGERPIVDSGVESGVESSVEAIPGAIRPDPESDDEVPPPKRADVALIVGIVLGIGGVALIIFVAIALFTPRG